MSRQELLPVLRPLTTPETIGARCLTNIDTMPAGRRLFARRLKDQANATRNG
jgi:hypothetical protein